MAVRGRVKFQFQFLKKKSTNHWITIATAQQATNNSKLSVYSRIYIDIDIYIHQSTIYQNYPSTNKTTNNND
jgi:hypothetical protein